jgi:protoporphyrinogen oxidase
MPRPISRSLFLKGLVGLTAGATVGKLWYDWMQAKASIPCKMLGPSMSIGHKLRDGATLGRKSEQPPEECKVTIIGAGISGLSAAWWLKRQGMTDFRILELESHVGGNSASGSNRVSAYPWGAHYVPLANQESQYVRMLFEELGIIAGYDSTERPIYNELFLCHEPQERLFKDGSFQEGLVPKRGLQKSDSRQIAKFFETVKRFRDTVGSDGKPAFAIPLDLSSTDQAIVSLDKLSMSQWLQDNGFDSKPLLWYVNYCCRDDYGSALEHVSAWAGLHYFAGRRGNAANAENNSIVTWPEGNGFLVDKLKQGLKDQIISGAPVIAVSDSGSAVDTVFVRSETGECLSTKSERVIFAAPRFISKFLLKGDLAKSQVDFEALSYAPWLVANITLRTVPRARGTALAWDNVSYYSRSLGYVVATHQNITTRAGETVVTYYLPLSGSDPNVARHELLSTSSEHWSKVIVADLEQMHPEISKDIIAIELWPWGHGMIRPSVGFIWGDTRRKMKESQGKVFFAHSDMSGISNFEEAQYHGIKAAQGVLDQLRRS